MKKYHSKNHQPDVSKTSSKLLDRRHFGKVTATAFGAAAGFHFFPALGEKKLEKPTLAGIGAGGKGVADINGAKKAGFEVVALVDVVDTKRFTKLTGKMKKSGQLREDYPDAAFFTDYREMLADLGDKVDAVTVSTPDHHHFHASAMAMNTGKHVYCQKPLTHSIWEARTLAKIARKTGVVSQMGNQAHAQDHMRRCVELVRAGVVGKVKEIHAWTNRPIWPQGFATPPEKQPVPAGIEWEQWIGPAPWIDYSPAIAPFAWRGWWDYGTGALGDMACHIMDLGYWAVCSGGNSDAVPASPICVQAKQNGATNLSPPINSIITWDFGKNEFSTTNGFKFHWYDGYTDAYFDRDDWRLVKNSKDYNHPNDDVLEGVDFSKYGSVVIGEQGKLFFHRQKENWMVKDKPVIHPNDFPVATIPRASGEDNYQEFFDAVTGKITKCESNFDLAGPMTETILLGVIAQRNPDTKLNWNRKEMQIEGRPELSSLIRREYRNGWQWNAKENPVPALSLNDA